MNDLIGLFAATLTTISFLPQTLLVIRTGRTDGISATMYAMFTVGVGFWLIFGVIENSLPVIIANAVTLVFATTILSMKLRAISQSHRKALPA